MTDHPHKRSDPEKLLRESQQIPMSKLKIADQQTRESVIHSIGRMFQEARDRRQAEANPPPEIRGAKVIGIKKQTDA